jgi:hypothetical protein
MRIGVCVAIVGLLLAFGMTASQAKSASTPYAVVGTGVEIGLGSTLTIDALSAGEFGDAATGVVVWTPADRDPIAIAVDCLRVHTSSLWEPYGIGHISIGSGIGSDGIRYYLRAQKDGDTADLGFARLSTTGDLAYECGTPTGGYFFTGLFRAAPPVAIVD